jgi:AcrR family transcriptional regulator
MVSVPAVPSRTAQKLDTRERLLSAAQRLFATQGLDATTVEQVAREAGTSRANFYLHFPGKEDLLHALRREMWRMALGFYEDFARLPDTTLPTLRTWLARISRAWRRDGGLTRIVLGATPQAVEREYQQHLAQYVEALTRDAGKWPGMAPAEARRRAYVLIVQLERCMNDQDHIDLPVDRSKLLDTLAAVWAATLVAPAS